MDAFTNDQEQNRWVYCNNSGIANVVSIDFLNSINQKWKLPPAQQVVFFFKTLLMV
jgi:hypothetical protein